MNLLTDEMYSKVKSTYVSSLLTSDSVNIDLFHWIFIVSFDLNVERHLVCIFMMYWVINKELLLVLRPHFKVI